MTKKMMQWFLDELAKPSLAFNQVEAYEGQFDDLDNDTTVFPPAAFVVVERPENTGEMSLSMNYQIGIYLVTSHIHGTGPDTMLDIIDALIAALHAKPVRYELDLSVSTPPDAYFGRCFFKTAEWFGIFPGKCAYKMTFIVRR